MSIAILPPYGAMAVTLPPSYSTEPLADEQTVASTPRLGGSQPQGNFVKKWSQATLILKDQEADARLPTYNRGGKVTGELGLENVDKITCVVLKLSGHMRLSSADSGTSGACLVSETKSLWRQEDGPNSEQRYITLVNYRPRARPNRPIVLLNSVFDSIKPDPEEWLQVIATMKVRPHSKMRPIECHLFIPSIQTYALTDTIPIHLQLCSALKSLCELLSPTSSPLHPPAPDRKLNEVLAGPFAIRLSITREIVVEVNGRRRFQMFTIGVGKLWPIPPIANGREDDKARSVDGDVCLDWQGEVKCWAGATSGGFSASGLLVKDFLILALTPPNPRTSPLIPLQFSHGIRLVTDPWLGVDSMHPQDS